MDDPAVNAKWRDATRCGLRRPDVQRQAARSRGRRKEARRDCTAKCLPVAGLGLSFFERHERMGKETHGSEDVFRAEVRVEARAGTDRGTVKNRKRDFPEATCIRRRAGADRK